MEDFAEKQFEIYLRSNLDCLEHINVHELLLHLTGCLSTCSVERLNAFVRNNGNSHTLLDFYLELGRCDNWVPHFINALRKSGHRKLAQKFQSVYSSYLDPEIAIAQALPYSRPRVPNQHNQQSRQEIPPRSSSLPGPIPPASLDTLPGPSSEPSQSFNQAQPEQEMSQTSPSPKNNQFRSLPSFRPDPPAPPRSSLSHDVSAPIHLGGKTLEEESSRSPVPESTPYLPALSEADVMAIQTVPETRTTPSYSPSTSREGGANNGRRQPVRDEMRKEREAFLSQEESLISENPPIVPDPLPNRSLSPSSKQPQSEVSIKPSSEDVSLVKVAETRTTPSYSPSTSSEGGANNWRGQPVRDEMRKEREAFLSRAANPPEQPVPAPKDRSVRKKVVDRGQRNGQSADRVADVSDSRPVGYRSANRETTQEEPSRERPANSQVPSGSSCRPLDDYEEECLNKPGVLLSTVRYGDDTTGGGASSELSRIPELEISNTTEINESSHVSDRSSPPPPSTPNSRSLPITNRRSPEENDFSYDSKPSPQRRRELSHSLPKQPEENSYGSRDLGHYGLDFNEEPTEDLTGDNDDILRNRTRRIPSTSEPTQESAQQKYREKEEGRDRERMVLMTITVASVCLSLYLLWKIRQN